MTERPTSGLAIAMAVHPWRTLAGAFLAGAAIALDAPPRRRVASKLAAMARTATLEVLRDLAIVGVLAVLDTLARPVARVDRGA